MNADSDLARVLRSWLHEDDHESADRVLDLVVDQLDATPQRRATWWPAWRFPPMNSNIVRFGMAAVVVVLIAIVGYSFLPGPGGFGGQPTPEPTPQPTAAPSARPLIDGSLAAGTYFVAPLAFPYDSITFTFTVPGGWRGVGGGVAPNEGTEGPNGAAVVFIHPNGLYSDPCHGTAAAPPSVGDRVDDLARALGEHTAYEATAPTVVTLGGYSGLRMDLQLPSDIDFSTCDDGGFWVWDPAPFAQGPGNRWHLWILDVDGTRVVILAEDFATTSAQTQADLIAIVESVQITP